AASGKIAAAVAFRDKRGSFVLLERVGVESEARAPDAASPSIGAGGVGAGRSAQAGRPLPAGRHPGRLFPLGTERTRAGILAARRGGGSLMKRLLGSVLFSLLVLVPAVSRAAESEDPVPTAQYLAAFQNPDGGFGAKAGEKSSLSATSSAVRTLKNVGGSI